MARRGLPAAPVVITALLVAAAVGFALRPTREGRERPEDAVSPASADQTTDADGPAAAATPTGRGVETAPPLGSKPDRSIGAAGTRPRSPLENSPGYYRRFDPESASVITGRREAKAVDMLFSGGASTREDLAKMLLAALNARDERALHALRITREEFAVILWPEFPQSRPITNITADDAWGMSIAQSVAGAGRAIGEHGGKDFVFLRVESAPPFPYRNFVLYRDLSMVVRDRATGIESRLTFAPSFVERKGRVKALIFRD